MLFLLMFACLTNKTSTIGWRSPVYIQTFESYGSSEKGCYDKLLLQDMISKGLCAVEVKAKSEEGTSLQTEFVCKSKSYQIEVTYKTLKNRVLCSKK